MIRGIISSENADPLALPCSNCSYTHTADTPRADNRLELHVQNYGLSPCAMQYRAGVLAHESLGVVQRTRGLGNGHEHLDVVVDS
jgi:hypothetical protein